MAQFPLPVREGDFSYKTVFFADPGNGRSCARASPSKLILLLRPGKGKTLRDEAWHFYTAQLMHYGLPVTRIKEDAKAHLWNALEDDTLAVPARLIALEKRLKAKWQEEVLRAQVQTVRPVAGNGASRIASESSGTDVAINLPLPSHPLDVSTNTSTAPNQPSAWKGKQVDTDLHLPIQTPNQPAQIMHTPAPLGPPAEISDPSSQTAPSIELTPRRDSKDINTSFVPHPELQSSPSTSDDLEDSRNSYVLLSGVYQCLIAGEAEGWLKDDIFDLILTYDPSRIVWWAAFNMGSWNGLIQMNPGPLTADDVHLGRTFSLSWQLRNLQQRRVVSDLRCTGDMAVNWEEISVRLYKIPGFGVVEFVGVRMEGPTLCQSLQCEWDAFCVMDSSV